MLEGNLVELGGLFGAAFLAATLLPAQSEALLAAMVIGAIASVPVLLAVAGAGFRFRRMRSPRRAKPIHDGDGRRCCFHGCR